jgi:hypothetical protein
MSLAERGAVLTRLSSILLEAAGIAVREHDDDKR